LKIEKTRSNWLNREKLKEFKIYRKLKKDSKKSTKKKLRLR